MFGVYGQQASAGRHASLVINDLELAKRILIKDFDHFTDRQSGARDSRSQIQMKDQ